MSPVTDLPIIETIYTMKQPAINIKTPRPSITDTLEPVATIYLENSRRKNISPQQLPSFQIIKDLQNSQESLKKDKLPR